MKKNLILFFSSLIFLTLFLEIFIRFFFPQDLQRYWAANEKKYGLMVNKSNYVHKNHRFKSFKAKYTFGEYGNRITIKNHSNNKRDKILILGESFTFGWLLKDHDTFVHKLQMDNLNYNFINVAVGAWGTSDYTLFTELYCKEIKPKKIFVFLNTDDFYRAYLKGFYKLDNNNLIKVKKKINDISKDSYLDKKIPFYKFLKSNSHLFMLLRNLVYNLIYPPSYNPWSSDRYWPKPPLNMNKLDSKKIKILNEKILLKLKNESIRCNSELYLFFTNWAQPNMMLDGNVNKEFLLNANDFFRKNDIYFYENPKLMEPLYENPMDYIIDIDFHPNSKGANLLYLSFREEVKKILDNQ